MTLDIHPSHPHMLVVGLYDGNVAVYNLQVCSMKARKVDVIRKFCQQKKSAPNYMSTAQNGKHKDVVWQVGKLIHSAWSSLTL